MFPKIPLIHYFLSFIFLLAFNLLANILGFPLPFFLFSSVYFLYFILYYFHLIYFPFPVTFNLIPYLLGFPRPFFCVFICLFFSIFFSIVPLSFPSFFLLLHFLFLLICTLHILTPETPTYLIHLIYPRLQALTDLRGREYLKYICNCRSLT